VRPVLLIRQSPWSKGLIINLTCSNRMFRTKVEKNDLITDPQSFCTTMLNKGPISYRQSRVVLADNERQYLHLRTLSDRLSSTFYLPVKYRLIYGSRKIGESYRSVSEWRTAMQSVEINDADDGEGSNAIVSGRLRHLPSFTSRGPDDLRSDFLPL